MVDQASAAAMSGKISGILSNRMPLKSLLIFFGVLLLVLLVAGWIRAKVEHHELQEYADVVRRAVQEATIGAKRTLENLATYSQATGEVASPGLNALVRAALRHNHHIHSILYFRWIPEDYPNELTPMEEVAPWQPLPGALRADFLERSASGRALPPKLDLSQMLNPGELRELITSAEPGFLQGEIPLPGPSRRLLLAKAVYWGREVPTSQQDRIRDFRGLYLVVMNLQGLIDSLKNHHPSYRLLLADRDGFAMGEPNAAANGVRQESSRRSEPGWPVLMRLVHAVTVPPGERITLERRLTLAEFWPPAVIAGSVSVALLTVLMHWLWWSRRRQRWLAETAQRELDRERERAHKTLHAIDDAVLVVDADWRIRFVNPGAERMLGCQAGTLRGRRLDQVIQLRQVEDGGLVEDVQAYFLALSAEGRRLPVRLLDCEQRERAIDSRVSPLTFPDGNDGMVIVMRDVTVEQELMDRLAYQASHDSLTGLYNRAAFEGWIRDALAEEEGGHRRHAVIYIDLDRFKLVNDTCGHAAGDQLLRRVADHVSSVLRGGDLMARVGGDEFGILLRDCELTAAESIARRIMDTMEDFRFKWEDKLFQVHLSIGVVPVDRDAGSLKNVLMAADLACHVAKERGRNRIHVHALEDVSILRRRQEMQWLPRLHEALDNDRFELFLQPIRPLAENSELPVMNEFLIRLRSADGKLQPPGLFIPAAERYDLMWQIDRWMVENAIGYLSETDGEEGELYTINLSAQTFGDHSFAEFVEMTLEGYGVDAKRICFELTETAAVTNISVASELMQALKELGCRILLDDFGSGLSSFGYLKNLPIDYLKIDGQFVCDILSDPLDEVMVRMSHELAQVLQVQTIAEFIENREILEAVREIGIDYGQGYYLGRPAPVREAVDSSRAAG